MRMAQGFISLIILIFLSACESEQSLSQTNWEGSEDEFIKNFRVSTLIDEEPILLLRSSNHPVSGEIFIVEKEISIRNSYLNGLLHGRSVRTKKDGSRVEANYHNGLIHGEMKFYDPKDNLRSAITYKNGIVAR